MSLTARLKARIQEAGPITVADYMEAAVAEYYATRDPFGTTGDFTTAPEISQIFGELLGAWVADQWQRAGNPRATLLELGPGRGTLMKDALRATRHVAGFHEAIDVILLETSPTLTQLQQKTLGHAHPRITWINSFDALPSRPLFFIANEFFDALPVRQFIGNEERMVHTTKNGFTLTPGNVTREVCEAGITLMRRLAGHIARFGGAGVVIDYGYAEGAGDTLQAMHTHAYADPLSTPGEADLTAHVDFSALAAAARGAGTQAHGPVPQGAFLRSLGAELRAAALCRNATSEQKKNILSGLERLLSPAQMGELFKVLMVSA